jgi:hypothetical protein
VLLSVPLPHLQHISLPPFLSLIFLSAQWLGREEKKAKGEGRREKGEGRREKGEGRREKGEGRREGRNTSL